MPTENINNYPKGYFYPTGGWSEHGFWRWGNVTALPGIYYHDNCLFDNNGEWILDPRFNPFLSDTRIRSLRQLTFNSSFDRVKLADYLQEFGFALPQEIESICREPLHRPVEINRSDKYLSWEQVIQCAKRWQDHDLRVGLSHGSFDPPHPFHSRNWRILHDHCDVVLVGFDSDATLRQRKGADRPRFPLSWRVWETTGLPVVDHTFVIPFDNTGTNEDYFNLYQQLGVKVLITAEDHPLRREYHKRMDRLKGKLLLVENDQFSSTSLSDWLYFYSNSVPRSVIEDTEQYFGQEPFVWASSKQQEINYKVRQANKLWGI